MNKDQIIKLSKVFIEINSLSEDIGTLADNISEKKLEYWCRDGELSTSMSKCDPINDVFLKVDDCEERSGATVEKSAGTGGLPYLDDLHFEIIKVIFETMGIMDKDGNYMSDDVDEELNERDFWNTTDAEECFNILVDIKLKYNL